MNISGIAASNIRIDDLGRVKSKLYGFADTFDHCNVYDSNGVLPAVGIGRYEFLAGLGLKKKLPVNRNELSGIIENGTRWIFGYFEYQDIMHAHDCQSWLYEAEIVFAIERGASHIKVYNNGVDDSRFAQLLADFEAFEEGSPEPGIMNIRFVPQTSREEYLRNVENIRQDIIHGRYYEMNYCIEFRSPAPKTDYLPYFLRLNSQTRAPFAAFVKHPGTVIMCSSPERFLHRSGETLVSQPIKGTNSRREGENNIRQLEVLQQSVKERAENVMIVDLVRNDLARVCRHGTIKVDELCGAYAFRSVNHLISTVSGRLKPEAGFFEIMDSVFPMGSMTGAPKIEVMKHIARYEHAPRGIYSGCLGYIDPDGNFDFNVLIRSLVYNEERAEISYKVGSAITYDSVPEHEYEECLLKGARLADAMQGH